MKVQVGTNDKETISIDLKKIDTEVLGVKGFDASAGNSFGKEMDYSTRKYATGLPVDSSTVQTEANKLQSGGKPITDAKVYQKLDTDGKASATEVYVVGKNDKGEEVTLTATQAVTDGATATDKAKVAFTLVKELDEKDLQAMKPLDTLDKALATVDSLRSDLGAIQNRMQSTINNLNNSVNNLSAARSRIQDADFAVEVSNMSRGQILQQAGTAVLAQANQVPNGVLSLLR